MSHFASLEKRNYFSFHLIETLEWSNHTKKDGL